MCINMLEHVLIVNEARDNDEHPSEAEEDTGFASCNTCKQSVSHSGKTYTKDLQYHQSGIAPEIKHREVFHKYV